MEIYSRHGGALLVAENSTDEASVRRALKDFDRDLVLSWDLDHDYQMQVWKVHKVISNDHPALPVLQWRENSIGRPLPLTHSLVEEVKRLREVDTMALVDAMNAKHRARLDKQAADDAAAITDDHRPYIDRGRVQIRVKETITP